MLSGKNCPSVVISCIKVSYISFSNAKYNWLIELLYICCSQQNTAKVNNCTSKYMNANKTNIRTTNGLKKQFYLNIFKGSRALQRKG